MGSGMDNVLAREHDTGWSFAAIRRVCSSGSCERNGTLATS